MSGSHHKRWKNRDTYINLLEYKIKLLNAQIQVLKIHNEIYKSYFMAFNLLLE